MKRMLVGCLLSFCMVHPVMASDLEKEQRWRDEVEDLIMDGESVDLMVDGRAVFSIFTEASEASDKGMIVVHGTGIHPNWEQVVQPIRVGMTNHGWHTLAIQMPILRNGAEYHEYAAIYPEVPARLQAAEAFMRERNQNAADRRAQPGRHHVELFSFAKSERCCRGFWLLA